MKHFIKINRQYTGADGSGYHILLSKRVISLTLCILLVLSNSTTFVAGDEFSAEENVSYSVTQTSAGFSADISSADDLIISDSEPEEDDVFVFSDESMYESAAGMTFTDGETGTVESFSTADDLVSGTDDIFPADAQNIIPDDLTDGILVEDFSQDQSEGSDSSLLPEETIPDPEQVLSEDGTSTSDPINEEILQAEEFAGIVEEESGEPETYAPEEKTEDLLEEETEEDLILTATEEGELHDPTVAPDEAADTAPVRKSGLLRSRALGAAAYNGSYGNQLSGFSQTCYEARSSHYLAGETGGFSMTYNKTTSPFSFEAAVKDGKLVEKSDGYIDYSTRMSVEKAMQSSLDAFCYDHPEVFWTRKGSYTIKYGAYKNTASSTGYTGYVSEILYTPEEVFSGASGLMGTFTNAVLQVYNSLISASGTDLDQDGFISDTEFIYAAHNYICSRVSYARDEYNEYLASISTYKNYRIFSPYDVFTGSAGNKVVCEGYSRAMKILCDKAGIGCACIAGDNHMWNAVQLDGVWYLMDLTWDDADPVTYQYFLAGSDSAHKQNGDFSGSGLMTFTYPSVSSTAASYRLGAFMYEKGVCRGEVSDAEKYDISKASLSSIADQLYTGSSLKPSVSVVYGITTLKEGVHYTLSYTSNTAAGTATVTAKGKGIFTGSISRTFKILPRPVSGLALTAPASVTYTGSAFTPDVTLVYGSVTLKKGTDYKLSYSSNINAGTAKITITGTGNYSGSRTTSFTISARSISLASNTAVPAQTYTGGKALTPSVTLKYGSVVLKNGTDYTLSWQSNKNPGTAVITATGKGNWTGTKKISFSVKTRDFSTVSVHIPDTYYTGKARKSAPVVTVGSVTLVNGRDYKITYKNNKNIGTAKATLTGLGYYTGSRTVTFKIVPKKPSIKQLKSSSKKKLTVKWKKISKAKGYQVQVSADASFASCKSVRTGSVSKTIGNLKRKTWYYVRVRSYAKVKGKTYYSSWSEVKKVKIK